MSAARPHKKVASAPPVVSTLACEMTETLAAFRAYLRFESQDPQQNRDRFYDLLWQPTLFGEGALVRVWGRHGRSATMRVQTFPDRAGAQATVRQLVRTRLRHGYAVTDWQ